MHSVCMQTDGVKDMEWRRGGEEENDGLAAKDFVKIIITLFKHIFKTVEFMIRRHATYECVSIFRLKLFLNDIFRLHFYECETLRDIKIKKNNQWQR